jgi:hypothetical protein
MLSMMKMQIVCTIPEYYSAAVMLDISMFIQHPYQLQNNVMESSIINSNSNYHQNKQYILRDIITFFPKGTFPRNMY